MKITIIQFSPSGSIKKVTSMLERELKERSQEVQVIDITGEEEVFIKRNTIDFLNKNIQPHDILLIGAPVYAHHLQYHILGLIKALPKPNNIWGKYAIPLVCYGGISSGIALKEAAKKLKNTGRIIPAGMKISAPHSMTKAFMKHQFNKDKLQSEQLPEIIELVDRILEIGENKSQKCYAKKMNYNGVVSNIKAKIIFKEKVWHEKRYPQIEINKEICTNCGKCARICPVNHLTKKNHMVDKNNTSPCIHCFNCVVNCSGGAIKLVGDKEKGQQFMKKMIVKNGNKEFPATAVYPLLK